MTDPVVVLWDKYGLTGFLIYVVVKEVWPFLRDKVWPQSAATARSESERIRKLEDRQVAAQERQSIAVEEMSRGIQSMALVITTNNERLSTLIVGFAQHSQEATEAISLMRERTHPMPPRSRQRPTAGAK